MLVVVVVMVVGSSDAFAFAFVVPQQGQGQGRSVISRPDRRYGGLQMKLLPSHIHIDGPERTRKRDIIHRDM
jgi:hypothetical protein